MWDEQLSRDVDAASGMSLSPRAKRVMDPHVEYDRASELFVCRTCNQGSINRSDFEHEKTCRYHPDTRLR